MPTWHRPHYRRSLASRVTLLTTMAVGMAVTAVALAAYLTVRTQSMQALDDSLRDRASAAAHYDALETLRVPSVYLGAADVRIIFVDSIQGRAYSADRTNQMRVGDAEYAVASGMRKYSARTIVAGGQRFRMVAVPADAGKPNGKALVLAQSLQQTDTMLSRLGLVALFFGLAGVIAAALAGWAVARNGLRPVRVLTAAAEEIARTERLDPIPIEGNDEIARLATAFNAMLGSLAASRDRQRQLVADAGHELRTPLTSLRTNLELLAQAGGSNRLTPQARAELLNDVQAQIAELTTLIGDLVELAREEPLPSAPQTVDLSGIVDNAVARVRRRAPALAFDVRTEPWWVTGDATGLERAITNLLDNAAKWSPEQGTVTVELIDGTLRVTDQGKGIPEKDQPHVFERFYRSADSRSMPGSGLGLS
ncbi:MAG: HAMP domain-containing histidine kinase, partial [Actinomycetota bacterium]|nr:HAMP domain-containing histidine kinase [Actinomycetota bacterium]